MSNVPCEQSHDNSLAYLVEIFKKLSDLNKSMQGPQMHALIQKDKVTAFIKKLELQWICNL